MNWNGFFNSIKNKEYFINLKAFLEEEYNNFVIYPEKKDLFNAFKLCEVNNIKVVIIGQDPYFNKDQAMGLAFSIKPYNHKLPPSLINIYKELCIEFNNSLYMNFNDGDLTYLSKQGVFLINPILSVREKEPLSHDIKEYKFLFKDIMEYIDKVDNNIVFILLGNKAKGYKKYITNKNRLIIEASHPSPLGANKGGFFNTNIFVRTNEYLKEHGLKEINWSNNSLFDDKL